MCVSPGEAVGVSPVSVILENLATENPEHNCQPMPHKETEAKMLKIRSDIDSVLLERLRIKDIHHKQIKDLKLPFLSRSTAAALLFPRHS